MRTLMIVTLLTACDGGTTPEDAEDTDLGAEDTDVVADDTDAGADDTDEPQDTEPPPARNTLIAGTWTPTLWQDACGVGFGQGLVAAAVAGTEDQFTLTMNEGVNGENAVFNCEIGEDLVYICDDVSFANGTLETCLYQSAMGNVWGELFGDSVSVEAYVSMSAVGQYCPPIPPCEATATASANID